MAVKHKPSKHLTKAKPSDTAKPKPPFGNGKPSK